MLIYTARGRSAPESSPPPAGDWDLDSQLPSGLTLRTTNNHTTLAPSGWEHVDRSTATPTIETDGTAPDGVDTSVLRQYWGGTPDGESPDFVAWSTGYAHTFVATIMKISSQTNFVPPPSEIKHITWVPNGGGFVWTGFYLDGGDVDLRLVFRDGSPDQFAGRVAGPTTPVRVPVGEWFKLQVELRVSPVRTRVWVDDVLVLSDTGSLPGGFSQITDWNSTTNFGEMQLGSTWGGGNGIACPTGAVMEYARTAIWGD